MMRTIWITLCLCLLAYAPAFGVVALDACTQNATVVGDNNYTFTHATAVGSNRVMILLASSGQFVSAATYNGVALTMIAEPAASGVVATAMYLVAPATGTNTVDFTLDSSHNSIVRVCTFTGVNQASPIGTHAERATATVDTSMSDAVSSATGAMTVDVFAALAAAVAALDSDSGQANESIVDVTEQAMGSSTEVGAASVTMTWTFTSCFCDRAHVVVPLNAAVGRAVPPMVLP